MRMGLCQIGMWVSLLGVCAACGSRQQMSENQGVQTRKFFMKQRVNAIAAQGSPGGLDSEESALIQGSYKESMGKAQPSQDSQSRVLLLKDTESGPATPP